MKRSTYQPRRMSRRLHAIVAATVGAIMIAVGVIATNAIPHDYIALGIAILWGVTVAMCVLAYWEEVIR